MARKELNYAANNGSKKMSAKELMYAGAFAAIYIVLMLIIVMGSGIVPILYVLSPISVGAVCGTVYMLCVLKVRRFGAALIMGALFALIACSSNMAGLVMALCTSLLAELVLFLGKYQSKKMYLLSFVVFNLNMACPFSMLLFARKRFFELSVQYQGQSHADALAKLLPEGIYFAIVGFAVLGGIIGAFIANKLIKKHFEKAGVV
jgi:hypothetical protein